MSMLHKAFRFQYMAFQEELFGLLHDALCMQDTAHLRHFVISHQEQLCDPASHCSIRAEWFQSASNNTVQRLGEVALTKYYELEEDIGLDVLWQDIYNAVEEITPNGKRILLGNILACGNNVFDPGAMGTFFQSPQQVFYHSQQVEEWMRKDKRLTNVLQPVMKMYTTAIESNGGLYITF